MRRNVKLFVWFYFSLLLVIIEGPSRSIRSHREAGPSGEKISFPVYFTFFLAQPMRSTSNSHCFGFFGGLNGYFLSLKMYVCSRVYQVPVD